MNSRIKAVLIAVVALILATAVALSVTMCGKKPRPDKKPVSQTSSLDSTESQNSISSGITDEMESEIVNIELGDLDDGLSSEPNLDTEVGTDTPLPEEDGLVDGWEEFPFEDDLNDDFDFDDNDLDIDDFMPELDDLSYGKYDSVIQCAGKPVAGSQRTIDVDNTQVVWEDFYGFGTNAMTNALVDPGKIYYNEPMFEFDMNREKVLYPQVIRLVFQLDYMITEEEPDPYRRDVENNKDFQNYLNGIYSFDNANMKSMYAYLDKYKEMGAEILVDFGWKTHSRIANWYALPVFLPTASAPYDLKAYAKACLALYKNFKERGYDNVKYITFFNEPQNSEDFLTLGDSVTWYAKMVSLVDKEFKNAGLRDEIELWGPEQGQTTIKYYPYLKDFATFEGMSDIVDCWSIHRYYKGKEKFENNYYEFFNDMLLFINEYGKRICCTEMEAFDGPGDECQEATYTDWNDTYASYMIASLNVGVKNVCCWGFCNYYWSFPINGWIGGFVYEHTENKVENVKEVYQSYQEVGLLTNYVTPHCDVLMTDWTGDDIRVSTVKLADGNITILVETKGGRDKYDIDINFKEAVNKTFYRMSTNRLEALTEDYTLPTSEKKFENVGATLSDTLDGKDASLYVYTTKAPLKQIRLNDYSVTIKHTETYEFSAELLDHEADEIVWSISSATGEKGKIESTGSLTALYTPDDNLKLGDIVSIRATLKSDPTVYMTALLQIT